MLVFEVLGSKLGKQVDLETNVGCKMPLSLRGGPK